MKGIPPPRRRSSGRIALGLALVLVADGADSLAGQRAGPGGPPEGPLPAGLVTGSVFSSRPSGPRPLSRARVRIVGPGTVQWATTEPGGGYVLRDVPAGPATVSVEGVGHRPLVLEVHVPSGDTVFLDVELDVRPIPLDGITARGIPPPVVSGSPGGLSDRAEIDLRAIEVSPGLVQSGIDDAARGVAGNPGGEPAPALLMRGSTVDQKLLLLDGSPMYAPFHLGGLLPPFDEALLSRATHFVGGAPARYDGGLSYVLDLETRAGRRDHAHGSAFLDLLGGGASAESPLGARGSILGSTRFLHDLGQPLVASDGSPFGYAETLVRADFTAAPGHRISATWFWNREDVRLDLANAPVGPAGQTGSAQDLSPEALEIVRPDAATWGNTALSTRYRGRWGSTTLDATVAASRYRAALPLGLEDPAHATARTDWIRIGGEIGRPVGSWELRTGFSAERIDQQTRARAVVTDSVSEVRAAARSGAAGLYVEGSRPVGEDIDFRGAVRLDHFPEAGGLRIAPRLALTWSPTATADLTLSGGRFFQLPRGAEMELGVTLNDPGALSAGGALFPPAEATHLVVSLDQRLTPAVRLGVDGFLKGFRNLPGAEGRVLRSSGLDLRIRRTGEDLNGWLGYSLAWFWSPDGPARTADFTGRHLLTAGLEGRFANGWGASLGVSFGEGLPYTSVPVLGPETGVTSGAGVLETTLDQTVSGDDPPAHRVPTLDGFLRLDLELHREWEVSWGGRTGVLKPYLRLLNAVSSRDALFHYFDPWRSPELQALADRPLLPVLGAELRF